jgi:hypothetical protein
MSLGMIVRQPRHVVAKLNGWSESEEHVVLDRTKGADWGPDGEPVFSVAECRLRTTEVRTEPAASVRSAVALLMAEHEAFWKREQEERDCRKHELAGRSEDNKAMRDFVRVNMKGLANVLPVAPNLSVKGVAKEAGWKESLVRKYAREGRFETSLLPKSSGKGKHKQFDPVKVLDDIKSIKSKLGTKGRRKRK